MTWTKQTKETDTTSQGFLEYPGFLVSGFLEAVSKWVKNIKASDTWTKITKETE